MKLTTNIAAATLALTLSVTILQAQHEDHAAPAASAEQAKGKMGMGMMGQMADRRTEMMGSHAQVMELVTKLSQSFSAIQAEKDPEAVAKKLAEHGALLKELEAKVKEHSTMMQKMEKSETAAPAAPAAPPVHQH